jgi:solute carrier family 38 (sodium-coupled neutral amino acid transporter), member 11
MVTMAVVQQHASPPPSSSSSSSSSSNASLQVSSRPSPSSSPSSSTLHGNHNRRRHPISSTDVLSKTPTGLWGASSNLINSIVGAGIIGIPYALYQSGFVVGIFLLLLVAYLTDQSLRLLMDLAYFHPTLYPYGIYTFEDLIRIPFGRYGYNFVLASMFIMAYGAMIAYLIIIKDTIPKVVGWYGSTFLERELIMTLSSILIILPLAWMRDISALACTSLLSVTADAALVIIIVVFAPVVSTIQEYNINNNNDNSNHNTTDNAFQTILADFWISNKLFIGLGVLSTAMACQHSAFLISGSLYHLTPARWSLVTSRSLVLATIMTLLLGIFGFLGYLDQTQGNVLNNFPERSLAINAGRALLGLTMYLTYPMESFVARHVIGQLFFQGNLDHTTIGTNGEMIPEQRVWWCGGHVGRREWVTIALFIGTVVPALLVDDLGPVLSITGSLGASCIAYIAPGLVYLGVNGGCFLQWVEDGVNPSRQHGHRNGNGSSSSSSATRKTSHVELPIMGDATARIPYYAVSSSASMSMAHSRRQRPFWWYPLGLPIWVAIAKRGERGTREFLLDLDRNHHPAPPPGAVATSTATTNHSMMEATIGAVNVASSEPPPLQPPELIPAVPMVLVYPNCRDFCISIFMIVFGVIAVVCGVLSNVYVQIHDIFFTPH